MPRLIRPIVVSKPAARMPTHCTSSSAREALAVLLGADHLREQVVAEPRRRSSISARKYSTSFASAGSARATPAGSNCAASVWVALAVHSVKRAIDERDAHHLADHRRGHDARDIGGDVEAAARERPSTHASQISCTSGRSRSTVRGVNAFARILRRRVCGAPSWSRRKSLGSKGGFLRDVRDHEGRPVAAPEAAAHVAQQASTSS